MLKPSAIVGSTFLLLSMVTLTDACPAQGGVTWTQLSPANSPSAREAHAMAYDAARQRVVLFGGQDAAGTLLNDTWTWDGVNWTQRFPITSPSGGDMAYDAARQRVVLFAGYPSPETWEWDGINWTQRFPITSPSGGDMAYDAARQRVVLFAGYPSPETWEWDGINWTQRFPITSPSGGDMAYDAARQRVVLFAGYHSPETWEWDGINWTQATPAQSPPSWRMSPAMAYDAARQRIVLMGGAVPGPWAPNSVGDQWEWDGSTWVEVVPGSGATGVRHSHTMAYDEYRGEIIVFGGVAEFGGIIQLRTILQDTWQYSSLSPASFSTYGTGCPGSMGDLTLNAAPYSSPWTGDTFSVELGNLPFGSFPFMAIGFTQVSTPIPQLPGCTQLTSAQAAVSLTLNGNTATWSQAVPVNPALVGWSLFLQGAAFNAGGANPLRAALSNGGQATIGMR